MSDRTRGDLLILLAAFIWGVAFYYQKIAMLQMGPLLFLGIRGAVAALALLPFAFVEQRRICHRRVHDGVPDAVAGAGFFQRSIVPFGLLAGVIFFLAGSTQQTGLVTASITNTGFLTALYVVVTPFLFWIVRRQRPGRVTWISVGLAFLGVWGLSGGALASFSRGDILVACSSVFWACLIIVSGQSSRHAQPLSYTCVQFVVVAVLGLLAASILEVIEYQAIRAALVPILYVGVLSSAFTFGLMAIAMQSVPAPRASIILSMETVFAALAGYLFLGERLPGVAWLGAGLILLAVFMVQRSRD
ncbi:DMT family transporter [Granulosicoccus antarcticus]|uniref:EamA domain-containing protein n=1 Tax=Granulosicoccus antarcticus IMCC3135 TaxID=1192854 RepID=A0A2Z2P064_9GAMM|nr:DMT family transporter [Granulosicoccus antarcticus]ASJ75621.1 hypothetical protein IMCC3135_27840 [Granulosicoccus antarcticus IMCC3135]